jgi:hypothetical protein
MKKVKCKICKHRFSLSKEMLYVAQEIACGVNIFTPATKMFDAVDCPKCGCQLLLNIREPAVDAKGGAPNG